MMERRRKRKKNTNTCDTYESHLRNHILPFAGHRTASSLRRPDSMAFVDYLLDKEGIDSACTVVQIFKTWRILVHYMLDEDVRSLPTSWRGSNSPTSHHASKSHCLLGRSRQSRQRCEGSRRATRS